MPDSDSTCNDGVLWDSSVRPDEREMMEPVLKGLLKHLDESGIGRASARVRALDLPARPDGAPPRI